MNYDLRPLDGVRSIKTKLGLLVAVTIVVASVLAVIGTRLGISPWATVPVAVMAALAVTQLLARGMTSPLREMTLAAQRMAQGDYSQRVHASSRDEVGELARAFNRTAATLEMVDRHRRDLVANVSHELRTPISALQAVLENLVDGVSDPGPGSCAPPWRRPSAWDAWWETCSTCPASRRESLRCGSRKSGSSTSLTTPSPRPARTGCATVST